MSRHRVIRSLATAARRTPAGYLLMLVACIVAACTWTTLAGRVEAATRHARPKATPASAQGAPLDVRRGPAAAGDAHHPVGLQP